MSDPAPPHALLRPRIAVPFVLTALIWGSTWYVIRGQIAEVPAQWAVAYRFALAAPAMFALALLTGKSLAMPRRAHGLAIAMGLFQFSANFTFVYLSEEHLTSGIVALIIGMMFVTNAILGRLLLGQPVTRRFMIGSAIALAGIGLLLANEARTAPLGGNVAWGAALALGGMLSASLANVLQAGPAGRDVPLVSLLSWSILYGVGIDVLVASAMVGPPQVPAAPLFWAGTAWLALVGTVVTFPLYYQLVRELGAGRAAYNGVLVIVIAMTISTLLEGYRWSGLAIAGAALAVLGMVVALRARQVAPAPASAPSPE
ncbi:putative DMT superfamily transporter inner membrane protein [Tsuneonella dongtanensis]|uniref:Putative DMT superfamily transporter inner membrane protein n=1 Tax=Tsuneonella dongtanensis TaxID=692370 RepID=A0A1B2AAF8_9SPHN|nr:DMT family transporter [Tsuneonella dongtanensis]ANY19149.1 putative DMT superfamily transporter inner membrane protein [Tsuneonella dongtanensis]